MTKTDNALLLRALRLLRDGVPQREIGRQLGLSHQTINNLACGRLTAELNSDEVLAAQAALEEVVQQTGVKPEIVADLACGRLTAKPKGRRREVAFRSVPAYDCPGCGHKVNIKPCPACAAREAGESGVRGQ